MAKTKSQPIEVAYKAAPGARITDADAQRLGHAVEQLGPGVTPDQLLDFARAKSSPIHDLFEWDDAVAAARYRVDQARYYLRSVWEVPVDADGRAVGDGARAFYAIDTVDAHEGATRAFYAGRELHGIPGADVTIVQRALQEATEWTARYRRIKDHLSDVFDAIDRATARLTRAKRPSKADAAWTGGPPKTYAVKKGGPRRRRAAKV